MIVLSHYQTRPLLAAREEGQAQATTSLDLNLSQAVVALSAEGVRLSGSLMLSWEQVEQITADENKCFLVEEGGTLREIRTFSEATNWVRSLYPMERAPTMLVSGLTMHRIEGIDPLEDTRRKVRTARPRGTVLDTATGLGYTAIQAAERAEHVVTVELDPACLEIARLNPWSAALFDNPAIEQVVADAFDAVEGMDAGQFSTVIHDPPAFALAGHLYSGDFYAELHRVMSSKGRLFHYIGDPESKTVSRTTRGVIRRLHDAGFSRVQPKPRAYGVVAYK